MLAAMNPLPVLTALALSLCLAQAALPSLKVSENKRFLVTADGQPFFYLGDTTWELFHRLNREESIQFLDNRAARKFNVLQSVAIAELEGHTDPNAYGHRPFADLDVTKPAVKDGPQNDYWDHVDFIELVDGSTDDIGSTVVENKVHAHDFHATILHLPGMDHERLTFRHGGRDYRLTDVHGNVVQALLA